jgi:hypothetical protein
VPFVFCNVAARQGNTPADKTEKDLSVPPPRKSVARNFHRFFLPFPQRSLILHSFRTTQDHFSVARDSAFAQSAHSANVRCIEPARDCSRAGGDWWFSRVNHREGFSKCASARFRKLGRCGLLRESFRKKQDWRRPLTQSPQANVCESSIRGLIACRVCQETCAPLGLRFPEFTIRRLTR